MQEGIGVELDEGAELGDVAVGVRGSVTFGDESEEEEARTDRSSLATTSHLHTTRVSL